MPLPSVVTSRQGSSSLPPLPTGRNGSDAGRYSSLPRGSSPAANQPLYRSLYTGRGGLSSYRSESEPVTPNVVNVGASRIGPSSSAAPSDDESSGSQRGGYKSARAQPARAEDSPKRVYTTSYVRQNARSPSAHDPDERRKNRDGEGEDEEVEPPPANKVQAISAMVRLNARVPSAKSSYSGDDGDEILVDGVPVRVRESRSRHRQSYDDEVFFQEDGGGRGAAPAGRELKRVYQNEIVDGADSEVPDFPPPPPTVVAASATYPSGYWGGGRTAKNQRADDVLHPAPVGDAAAPYSRLSSASSGPKSPWSPSAAPPIASPEEYDDEYRDYGKIRTVARGAVLPPDVPPPPPPSSPPPELENASSSSSSSGGSSRRGSTSSGSDSGDNEDRRTYRRMMDELSAMEVSGKRRQQQHAQKQGKLQQVQDERGLPIKRWEYSGKGVLVQEVDEGQPCLECQEKCPGFTPHVWRKTCSSCKCPRDAHDVYHEEWVNVRERLGFKPDRLEPRDRSMSDGYCWVPPGLHSTQQIEKYFSELPPEKVPEMGSVGEKYRDKQLVLQLPKQDLALAYCKHVETQHHASYEDFISARNEIALDIGYVREAGAYTECPQCLKTLAPQDLGVVAPKFGDRTLWHPACFTCTTCKELLVDLTYCAHDDLLYCERHYAEQLKPRCAACDELIFSGEYTKAMSKDWHSGHFSCWQCDESLTGQRYVLRDDHPYCIKCYESVFANVCEECNKIIGIDSKDLSYKEKHWHEACFLCNKCRVSLVDKQFGSKGEKIYCGNCYDSQFASRCDGCGEIFRAGTKKMEYKTRQWHEKCFCCCVCKTPIGTKSFIPREQEIYCATCYEEKFATRCVKCNKIITSGGVTYKNEPWHRECFTCTNCNTSLAGQRFTSRDEKPYCADCFGELFAKRCTACSKPITGIGGTRFISFEDRHWHNDCFICAMCKTSLVGRGFITDADDIICPDCAKQKLM
ncbi:uncharacterized protein LOC124545856 [Schistocerca americana]|uniref:uncharacterized protein LOC124545856 n=1 Tax=Schistocerca americana TaxID=7009 RepID=UPI001F501CB0|nr:uncharacterized protein LOC124545856 [Schistocerca americana]